jgi:YggT family protein
VRILYLLVQAATLVVLARVVMGWLAGPARGPVAAVQRGIVVCTEPVLAPVRQVVRPVQVGASSLDLSPILVVLALQLLGSLLSR